MNSNLPLFVATGIAIVASSSSALVAQDPIEKRLRLIEQRNKDLQQQVEALSSDVERIDLGGLIPPLSTAKRGVGQGAAKVYDIEQGLSIGGYGEFLYTENQGGVDEADAQRAILYVGYKFDDKWVFNSEIEVEHGSTSTGGSVSLEFGYLDYLHSDAINLRGGLLLSPMGLINQLHEPTAFLASSRPQTEKRIIPSTWREMGFGSYGNIGDFSYQSYMMTALDGEGFGAKGLRGGRQKGGESDSDDWSLITRVDYVGTTGLMLGGSLSYGDHGQDNVNGSGDFVPAMRGTIWEAHVDYRTGPWTFRALYSAADIRDAGLFNASTGANLASGMNGYYAEVAFDVMTLLSDSTQGQLRPFIRYEDIDTQADMPTSFTADPQYKDEIITFGVNYKPIPQVVVKVDYENWNENNDKFNILFGYVF